MKPRDENDRIMLRALWQQYPHWSARAFALELNRSESWVRKWIARFRAAPRDDASLKQSPKINSSQRQQVLVEWNATNFPPLPYPAIQMLVEAQASSRPNALAVSDESRSLTYGDLNREANHIAHRLRALGVGPDQVVAICLVRSANSIIAMLATLKAGAAYLPLDPSHPKERLAAMALDAQVCLILTDSRHSDLFMTTPARIVNLDVLLAASVDSSEDDPVSVNLATHLAYVIYTSGSSGRPKGVAIEHRSLLNLVAWHIKFYQVSPADRAAHLCGVAFDAAVQDVWPHLAVGASIHIPPEEIRLAPSRLINWLADRQITLTAMPTPLAELALAKPWPDHSALRILRIGGQALHKRPAPTLRFAVYNEYGPTEATVTSTCAMVSPDGEGAPPIGRPIHNVQVYVLDAAFQPVPIGVPGDLYIGGAGLARGYLHRPDLTDAAFVSSPFSPDPQVRLYKTGDRAQWRPDGQLEFLGRLDFQVKYRGFRIELGEIEAALLQHPDIQQAVVIARTAGAGRKTQLMAYIVPKPGSRHTASDLRQFLGDRLPLYMIPVAFRVLKKLPLTSNGKVDRQALSSAIGTTL